MGAALSKCLRSGGELLRGRLAADKDPFLQAQRAATLAKSLGHGPLPQDEEAAGSRGLAAPWSPAAACARGEAREGCSVLEAAALSPPPGWS